MEIFLNQLRSALQRDNSSLISLFDTFAQEARVARVWLNPIISALPAKSRILEVGAGVLILSSLLQLEGFEVSAVEPIGSGFGAFAELQRYVRDFAERQGHAPEILPISIEALRAENQFSFAFSVHVMEHVGNIELALKNTLQSLRDTGQYWFICPNYTFPYEPHFNIPIVFSKQLTNFFFHKLISESSSVPDPEGTWKSLNWISTSKVQRITRNFKHVSVEFDAMQIVSTLERVVSDPIFAARRPRWIQRAVSLTVKFDLHLFAKIIPITLHPIIDCRIRRLSTHD